MTRCEELVCRLQSDNPFVMEVSMLGLFSVLDSIGGNGAKAYQCMTCGALISRSDRFLAISGNNRHLFVNPSGVECDFYTFSSCPGAVALGKATEAHTWFSGYRWRLAFCGHCSQHLGWRYNAISAFERPLEFWGILVSQLVSKTWVKARLPT